MSVWCLRWNKLHYTYLHLNSNFPFTFRCQRHQKAVACKAKQCPCVIYGDDMCFSVSSVWADFVPVDAELQGSGVFPVRQKALLLCAVDSIIGVSQQPLLSQSLFLYRRTELSLVWIGTGSKNAGLQTGRTTILPFSPHPNQSWPSAATFLLKWSFSFPLLPNILRGRLMWFATI